MFLEWLQPQPRHVVVKLNDMSSGEAHQVLDDSLVVERLPDGTPLYGVPQCREKTAEVRNEPVATVKAVAAELAAGQQQQLDGLRECIDLFEREMDRYREISKDIEGRVTAATSAVTNAIEQPPYLTCQEVARLTGWPVSAVRAYKRQGLFAKSIVSSSGARHKHGKFDPNRVWDDIAEIRSKFGRA